MSGLQMGLVFQLDLPQEDLWILMALADHAAHDGTRCFAGSEIIAWKCNCSIRQVQRRLKELRDRGYIEATGWRRAGQPCEYTLRLENAPQKPAYVPHREDSAAVRGGDYLSSPATLEPTEPHGAVPMTAHGAVPMNAPEAVPMTHDAAGDVEQAMTADDAAGDAEQGLTPALCKTLPDSSVSPQATEPDSKMRSNRPLTVPGRDRGITSAPYVADGLVEVLKTKKARAESEYAALWRSVMGARSTLSKIQLDEIAQLDAQARDRGDTEAVRYAMVEAARNATGARYPYFRATLRNRANGNGRKPDAAQERRPLAELEREAEEETARERRRVYGDDENGDEP